MKKPRLTKGGQLRLGHNALTPGSYWRLTVGRYALSDHQNGVPALVELPMSSSRYGQSLRAQPFHPRLALQ